MAATKANNSNESGRGLQNASKATRQKVAKLGGLAHHDKRGATGSDAS